MAKLPPLASLRAFEAAGRLLSFRRAAGELGVTPTAISHQVRLLEEVLGVRLFERRPRRVVLTEAGRELQPVVSTAFAAMTAAIERIAPGRRRRGITLSAPTAFTAKWLVPRLGGFARAHPEVSLRLHASDEVVDLHRGMADAAIRYGRPPFPGLVAEPLFEERFAPVCTPSLGVRVPADLRHQTLLHAAWRRVDDRTPTWERWCRRAGLDGVDTTAGTTFTDDSHLIQAVIAGQGVALLSLVLVGEELASGALVQPFGPVLEGHGYHLAHTGERHQARDVDALRDWLSGALREA